MIEVSKNLDITTLRISGRFDFRCVKDFQAALGQVSPGWVVDLEAVDYIDSAALGMLLLLRDHAKGTRVVVRNLKGQPREVLMMAKFDRMFAIEA
ncbi:MAG: STAS domain-containing protein [Kofleriaceae bacterium]